MLIQYQERKVCVFLSLLPKKIVKSGQYSHFLAIFLDFELFLGLVYLNHLRILIKTFTSCFHVCHSNIRRKNSTELVKISKIQPKMSCKATIWAFLASLSKFLMFLPHVITCAMMYHDDMVQKSKRITGRVKKCLSSGSISHIWPFF